MSPLLKFYVNRSFGQLVIAILLIAECLTVYAAAYGADSEALTVNANGIEVKLYTYRPACDQLSILFVFHGLNRKAINARDNAKHLADDECLAIFAPLFDKERFPNWRYHRAGVTRESRVQPQSQWTAPVLDALVNFSRVYIDRPDAKIYLFGHSAGAQFLSRVFAYAPLGNVERVVLANPSVFVAPTLAVEAPYGFAGVFGSEEAQRHLAAYLGSPITIYLGSSDIGDKYLVKSEKANQQGANRRERGKNIFYMGKHEAIKSELPFAWRLVEACGIGHSAGGMLKSPAIRYALGLRDFNMGGPIICTANLSK